ncbi:MAG: presenilin family intramembrane aspartyl protease PSH [Thermoplasmatota archaeon]
MPKKNYSFKKEIAPIFMMGLFFIFIYGLALLIIKPFDYAGMQAFKDSADPFNLVIFFSIIIAMTVIILVIAKYFWKQLIKFIILGAVGYTSFYVFLPLLALVLAGWWSFLISITLAVILTVSLFKYPEWYVIDLCGIIIGAGAIAIFGISLDISLVLILLIILAIYDAISVYKTKHMIDLADTVMDLKLPVLIVIPKIRNYSLIKETKTLKEKMNDDEEREAFFMGLGDIVMPGILVASTYHNIVNGFPVTLGVIVGTLLGFICLMSFVVKGKPQAGLPLLCGGAIIGYLLSSYLWFGKIVGLGFSR